MSTLRRIWGSWSVLRRLLTVGLLVLVIAGGAVAAYASLKRPGDVSNPEAEFVEEDPVKIPKRSEIKTIDWPTYQLNPERTGYLPGKYLDPPFTSSKWSLVVGNLIEHAPIVVKDRLYILDIKGIFYAIDKKTGKIDYQKDIGQLSAAAPGYSDGIVYLINLDPDQIVALRAKDGKELWRKPIDSPGSESSPVVVNDRLIFGCQCGSVYALNPTNGETIWQTETAGEIKSAVAYHKGTIFGSNYGGEFFAIDASDGGVKWSTPIIGGAFGRGGGSYSTPAIAYGRVYVGALDSRVYSLDIDTGAIAWTFSTGAEVYPGPAVADVKGAPPSVYIASADGQAYALDARSGELEWKRDVGDEVIGSGVVIGTTFYVSRVYDGGMVGYNAATGKEVFESDLGAYSPAVSDGERFYLVGYGTVRAFQSERLEDKRAKERREIEKAKKKADKQAARQADQVAPEESER